MKIFWWGPKISTAVNILIWEYGKCRLNTAINLASGIDCTCPRFSSFRFRLFIIKKPFKGFVFFFFSFIWNESYILKTWLCWVWVRNSGKASCLPSLAGVLPVPLRRLVLKISGQSDQEYSTPSVKIPLLTLKLLIGQILASPFALVVVAFRACLSPLSASRTLLCSRCEIII